jgi:hypothetical protein
MLKSVKYIRPAEAGASAGFAEYFGLYARSTRTD